MLVKYYEHQELRRELACNDSKREAKKLEAMVTLDDYHSGADRKDKGTERDSGWISHDEELGKQDTAWSFVNQDATRAYGREPRPILPECGLIESR